MVGSPMIIAWPNSDGSFTISQRQATQQAMPMGESGGSPCPRGEVLGCSHCPWLRSFALHAATFILVPFRDRGRVQAFLPDTDAITDPITGLLRLVVAPSHPCRCLTQF
jgi:hypothetical protein